MAARRNPVARDDFTGARHQSQFCTRAADVDSGKQYVGGGVAWSVGEIPTLILAIVVAIQWSRSDARRQRRRDRHVDRSGDAELEAYNAHLAELAERDARARR